MGRILILIGVVLVVLAFILPFASSMGFISNIGNIAQDVAQEPTAAELCNAGETLDVARGASTTSGMGSNTVTGRVTIYTCVNAAGERRDVTGAVVEDVLSAVTGASGIGSFITSLVAPIGLGAGGIILIAFGAVLAARSGRTPRQVYSTNYPSGSPIGRSGSPVVGVAPQQPLTTYPADQPSVKPQDANSVVNFVRDQLDAAYRNGQISREDYDRAIEKLKQR